MRRPFLIENVRICGEEINSDNEECYLNIYKRIKDYTERS